MQAMQYKISLPADYDMNIIKDRIQNNGFKTDGFEDLLFKAILSLIKRVATQAMDIVLFIFGNKPKE